MILTPLKSTEKLRPDPKQKTALYFDLLINFSKNLIKSTKKVKFSVHASNQSVVNRAAFVLIIRLSDCKLFVLICL